MSRAFDMHFLRSLQKKKKSILNAGWRLMGLPYRLDMRTEAAFQCAKVIRVFPLHPISRTFHSFPYAVFLVEVDGGGRLVIRDGESGDLGSTPFTRGSDIHFPGCNVLKIRGSRDDEPG